MKKLITVLMVLAVMLAPMATLAAEADTFEVSANAVEAARGDEVVIEVSLDKNTGIWGCLFDIVYDPAYFDLVKVDNGDLFYTANYSEPDDSGRHTFFGEAKGITNLKGDPTGVIAKYTFKVLKTAPAGKHVIDIYIKDGGNGYFIDAKNPDKDVTVAVTQTGYITVNAPADEPVENNPGETDTDAVTTAPDGGNTTETDKTPDIFTPPATVYPDQGQSSGSNSGDSGAADSTTKAPATQSKPVTEAAPVTDASGSTVEETTALGELITDPAETDPEKEYVTDYVTDENNELVVDIEGKPVMGYREIITGSQQGLSNAAKAIIFVIAGVVVIGAAAVVTIVVVVKPGKKKAKLKKPDQSNK